MALYLLLEFFFLLEETTAQATPPIKSKTMPAPPIRKLGLIELLEARAEGGLGLGVGEVTPEFGVGAEFGVCRESGIRLLCTNWT